MNNNIEEAYVSFEIAKLLKEKGFEVPTVFYFRITGSYMFPGQKPLNHNNDKENETAGGMTYVSAPTHALAIKWIRENFGIWVEIMLVGGNKYTYQMYVEKEMKSGSERIGEESAKYYDTPEEAESAAIRYTLQNLIK